MSTNISSLTLPTAKTQPRKSPTDINMLIFGRPKVGKSTFASSFENAIFFATESGLNHLEVYQASILTWEDLVAITRLVAAGKHPFKNIVIDTIDNAYQLCREYTYKKFNIAHESDLPFGKGYSLVNYEFKRVLTRLSLLPYGLVLISHSKEEELDTRTGKIKRTVPSLPTQGRETVLAMADMVLFFDIEQAGKESKRVIRTKPTAHYEAGDRTGTLPETIEIGNDPKNAFQQFLNAYENSTTLTVKK